MERQPFELPPSLILVSHSICFTPSRIAAGPNLGSKASKASLKLSYLSFSCLGKFTRPKLTAGQGSPPAFFPDFGEGRYVGWGESSEFEPWKSQTKRTTRMRLNMSLSRRGFSEKKNGMLLFFNRMISRHTFYDETRCFHLECWKAQHIQSAHLWDCIGKFFYRGSSLWWQQFFPNRSGG